MEPDPRPEACAAPARRSSSLSWSSSAAIPERGLRASSARAPAEEPIGRGRERWNPGGGASIASTSTKGASEASRPPGPGGGGAEASAAGAGFGAAAEAGAGFAAGGAAAAAGPEGSAGGAKRFETFVGQPLFQGVASVVVNGGDIIDAVAHSVNIHHRAASE